MFHSQALKALSMSLKRGGIDPGGGAPRGPAGSGLRHKHGSRIFRSLALPSPGVSVNLLAPALGGLATGQGRIGLLALFFKKERLHMLKLKKKKKKMLDHGLKLKKWRWGQFHHHKEEKRAS